MKYLLYLVLEISIQIVLFIIILFFAKKASNIENLQVEYVIPTIVIFRIVTHYIDKFREKLIDDE